NFSPCARSSVGRVIARPFVAFSSVAPALTRAPASPPPPPSTPPAKSSAPCVAKPIHASKFVIPLALSDEGNPLALSASGVRDLLFALASCVPTLLVGRP